MPTAIIDLTALPPGAMLDTRQAAQALGIKPKTLDNWRSSRRVGLRYTRVGAAIRYNVAELRKFIAANTEG